MPQEGFNAIVVLTLRIGDVLRELQPKIERLFVLKAFFVVGLVLIGIGLFIAAVPEEFDLFENVQHAEYVLNGLIEHIGLLLLLVYIRRNCISVEPLDQPQLVLRL